jgi:hypothetical protein
MSLFWRVVKIRDWVGSGLLREMWLWYFPRTNSRESLLNYQFCSFETETRKGSRLWSSAFQITDKDHQLIDVTAPKFWNASITMTRQTSIYSRTFITNSIKWTCVTTPLRIFQNEDVRILWTLNVFGVGVTLIKNKMGDAALQVWEI